MTIREILEKSGLTQTALAKRFEIPLRTVQDWVAERRTPPEYVINLLAVALKIEKSSD